MNVDPFIVRNKQGEPMPSVSNGDISLGGLKVALDGQLYRRLIRPVSKEEIKSAWLSAPTTDPVSQPIRKRR